MESLEDALSETIDSYLRDPKPATERHQYCPFHFSFFEALHEVMPKRSRADSEEVTSVPKRLRLKCPDRLSVLSDELLLRTLSFLPIPDLVLCERCASIIFP